MNKSLGSRVPLGAGLEDESEQRSTPVKAKPPGDEPPSGDSPDLKKGTDPRTDAANAQRFISQHGDMVRCCWEYGGWLRWDGRRYLKDIKSTFSRGLMRDCALDLMEEATKAYESAVEALKTEQDPILKQAIKRDMSEAGKLKTWARDSQQTSRVTSSLAAAEEIPGVSLEAQDLDTNGWELNCLNGVLDLRTGELHEHKPGMPLTKLAGCEWNPDAKCPEWEKFLEGILPEAEVREWLKQWSGTCLTNSISDRVITLFIGIGSNGKTVYLNVMSHILGDYVTTTSADFFASTHITSSTREYQVAQIHNARMLRAAETETNAVLNESLLKQVSGGDPCQGRHPYGRPFEFRPVCKPVLATNNRPRVQDTSKAIFDRLALIDFPKRYEKSEWDTELTDRLKAEGPGVLKWCYDGLQAWFANGNKLMESVIIGLAVDDYRREEDLLDGFFTDIAMVREDLKITVNDLFAAYESWAEDEKIKKPFGKIRFGKELKRRGFKQARQGQIREWSGIGLRGGDGKARKQDMTNQNVINFQRDDTPDPTGKRY